MKTRREFLAGSIATAAAAAVTLPELAFARPGAAVPVSAAHAEPMAFSTASEIAAAIRARQVSALEVVEMYLGRIARLNPQLNAICTLTADDARARARLADQAIARGESWGPLHGVPLVIKDCFETAGVRTTAGFPPLDDYVPQRDAVTVARLRRAGAIFLGKSNVPTLAMDWQTRNPIFGVTNNPWDTARTPGGSTGGGAAAVAAGLAALELGSDIGGSIRMPAHFCGICGLKPTEGRVSGRGHIPEVPGYPPSVRHMGCFGPLARSVADLELALGVLVGEGADWEGAPVPVAPAPRRPLASLQIEWTDAFGGVPVTAATREALAKLAAELDRRGARVHRADTSGYDFDQIWETWAELVMIEVSGAVPEEVMAQFSAGVEQAAAAGLGEVPVVRAWRRLRQETVTARRYAEVLARRDAIVAAADEIFATCDAVLCPVASAPAVPHTPAEQVTIAVDGTPVAYWMAMGGYAMPFNLTGNPVVVVPMGTSPEGLPIGVQIVGRRWRDMELLAVARAISEVLPPVPRPPSAL
jgi:amidase